MMRAQQRKYSPAKCQLLSLTYRTCSASKTVDLDSHALFRCMRKNVSKSNPDRRTKEERNRGYSQVEITHLPIQSVRRFETVESEKDAKMKSGAAGGLVRWHLLLMLGGRGAGGARFRQGEGKTDTDYLIFAFARD
ncbi:hypothetical protein GOBAR_DD36799 [Gossypium barbadense]|nr:hypothetical protein GOBAR_DD36799 [Gossypium barbadense]